MNSTQFVGSGFYIDPSLELIWIPLAIQLIATLIGAFVGFSFVMLWDRKKRREEIQQTKIRMLNAIIEELKSFQKMVELTSGNTVKLEWDSSTKDFIGTFISVTTPAFKSAVSSGNFSLLEPSFQTEIGSVYLTVDECKSYNDQALNFYATPMYASGHVHMDREASRLCFNFNNKISDLREQIKQILPKLESAKTDKKIPNKK